MPRRLTTPATLAVSALIFVSVLIFWHHSPSATNVPMSDQAIGVGFDLTASYGTVAISYPDGSIEAVAKVETNSEFHSMMQRLSLESSTHLAPPYQNIGESLDDWPRTALRRARKLMGFPASKDVGTLGSVIISLRALAEEKLGHSVSLAVATTPRLVALYEEDVDDALEYAGLKSGDVPYKRGRPPHELSTGYAGYGLGLCQDYTDSAKCWAEETDMPVEIVLAILYTRSALTTSLSGMKTAYGAMEWPQNYIQDFELGHDSLHNNPSEEYYWESLRDRIRELTIKEFDHRRITKVLLFGESALDATFLKVLEESIASLQDDIPEIVKDDPVFAAAKGAAEFAKRSPYKYGHNDNHRQTPSQGNQMANSGKEGYVEL